MIGLNNGWPKVSHHRTPYHIVRSHSFILISWNRSPLCPFFLLPSTCPIFPLPQSSPSPSGKASRHSFSQSWLPEPFPSLSRHYSSHSLQSQHPLRALLEALE